MKVNLLAILMLFSTTTLASSVEGLWRTEDGNSLVKVYIDKNGQLVGQGAPGGKVEGRIDTNNPDPKLKGRKLLGANIMWGFVPANKEKTKWKSGNIYDPDNGKTYSCKLKLKDEKLHIRGYIGISLFGRSTVWTREKQDRD